MLHAVIGLVIETYLNYVKRLVLLEVCQINRRRG